jgi:hypothetical protein
MKRENGVFYRVINCEGELHRTANAFERAKLGKWTDGGDGPPGAEAGYFG